MRIRDFVENEDGSADVQVDLTKEEHHAMLQLGLITAIQLGIEELGEQPEQGETE
jgi:hypothetical protein